MSTAYERAVESLRLVSREMEVADLPATDLVMATAAVNAMQADLIAMAGWAEALEVRIESWRGIVADKDAEIARLRKIEAAARAYLDDNTGAKRNALRAALAGGSE